VIGELLLAVGFVAFLIVLLSAAVTVLDRRKRRDG
jgi:hypothetical protein